MLAVPLVLVACFLGPLTLAQSTPTANAHDAAEVSGSGCVEAGIERGCFVLNDLKTGTTFNLFFKGSSPKLEQLSPLMLQNKKLLYHLYRDAGVPPAFFCVVGSQ
jgi:hypothetical protein